MEKIKLKGYPLYLELPVVIENTKKQSARITFVFSNIPETPVFMRLTIWSNGQSVDEDNEITNKYAPIDIEYYEIKKGRCYIDLAVYYNHMFVHNRIKNMEMDRVELSLFGEATLDVEYVFS